MKNKSNFLITIMLLIAFSFSVNGQDTEALIPLNADFQFKGYGGVELKQGKLIEEGSSFLSLRGGAVINNTFGFGLTAGAFLSEVSFEGVGSEVEIATLSPTMGYGGIFFEYIGFSSKKIHFTVPLTLGPGIVAIFEQTQIAENIEEQNMVEFSSFFVIEPGVNLEINLLKEVKLCIGGSYRLVSASDLDRVSDSDLSDVMFNVGLRIGGY